MSGFDTTAIVEQLLGSTETYGSMRMPNLNRASAPRSFCGGILPTSARVELAEALRAVTAKVSSPRRNGMALWKPITELDNTSR
jgi:hypothetical protein